MCRNIIKHSSCRLGFAFGSTHRSSERTVSAIVFLGVLPTINRPERDSAIPIPLLTKEGLGEVVECFQLSTDQPGRRQEPNAFQITHPSPNSNTNAKFPKSVGFADSKQLHIPTSMRHICRISCTPLNPTYKNCPSPSVY